MCSSFWELTRSTLLSLQLSRGGMDWRWLRDVAGSIQGSPLNVSWNQKLFCKIWGYICQNVTQYEVISDTELLEVTSETIFQDMKLYITLSYRIWSYIWPHNAREELIPDRVLQDMRLHLTLCFKMWGFTSHDIRLILSLRLVVTLFYGIWGSTIDCV